MLFSMVKPLIFYFGGKEKGDLQASHLLTTDFKFWCMEFAVGRFFVVVVVLHLVIFDKVETAKKTSSCHKNLKYEKACMNIQFKYPPKSHTDILHIIFSASSNLESTNLYFAYNIVCIV